jgi:methyltransferase OMS1
MRRRLIYGGAVYFGASSATYLYLRSKQPPAATDGAATPATPAVYDREFASEYDSKIGLDETMMGIGLLRRWLVRQASGDVLEVSAGTARNLLYYSGGQVRSLTVTDANPEMLARAFDKHRAGEGAGMGAPVRFCLANAERLVSAEQGTKQGGGGASSGGGFGPALDELRSFQPGSFDTVVDTFGLCSCRDPVAALRQMGRALRPGGRLLLLEHGRGSWTFVNRILDSGADKHCARWGCQWNRDIEALVREAGLVVERSSRWHLGTTHVVVARPRVAAAGVQSS